MCRPSVPRIPAYSVWNFQIHFEWGGRSFRSGGPALFSSALIQKAGVLALSTAIVFGPYLAWNPQALRCAVHTSVRFAGEVAGEVFDGAKEFTSFARTHRAASADFLLSEGKAIASASSRLSEDFFTAFAAAARDVSRGFAEDGVAAINALRDGPALIGMFAEVSAKSLGNLSAETLGVFSRLQAAARSSFTEPSLFERLLTPFASLARATYSGISSLTGRVFARNAEITRAPKRAEPSASYHPLLPPVDESFLGGKVGERSETEGISQSFGTAPGPGRTPVQTTPNTVVAPPAVAPSVADQSGRGLGETERVALRIIQEPSFTQADVDRKLALLKERLSADIASLRFSSAQAAQSNTTYINNVYNAVAATNNLDQASNLRLLNPTITDGTMANTSVSDLRGTFTSLSGGGLTLTGGASVGGDLTASGALTVSGDATVYGTFTPFAVAATGTVSATNFTATSTTATSSFAGGIAVQTDKFVVESGSGNVGIGTTSPSARLSLAGASNSTNTLFLISTSQCATSPRQ